MADTKRYTPASANMRRVEALVLILPFLGFTNKSGQKREAFTYSVLDKPFKRVPQGGKFSPSRCAIVPMAALKLGQKADY